MRKPLLNRSFNVVASAHSVIANDNATNVIANPEGVKQPLAAAPAKSSWSRKAIGSIAALLVAFLAACGDDSSSGKSEEDSSGIATYPTYDDLVHCTKSHFGEIAYVEDENTYFECTSNDWVEVDSAKVDSVLSTISSSSAEADSSKPRSSSSIKVSEKDTAAVEVKKVDSVTVVGFAQKGPFAKGSSVTVYGLDSLFAKTKTKFTGSVENDSGAFKVSKVALPSQFALVEVSGYYQNEVSGKKSSGSKTTLSALVDLSAGKSVKANVNLFTDLEFVRAKQLILNEKFNVAAAKQRAIKELLAAFGSSVKSETTATEISLLDTSSAGKALLAASLLMQGDLSASKFGSRLSGVEDLFAATGALDSAELRAAIADWASKEDSTDNFAKIRENIKSLKIMGVVPDFESTLYAFWIKDYGLGNCTEELESTIKKNENKLSDNYGAGYACTAKRWHKATALDTELGLCTGKMEGQFKEYKGKKDTEYYVCKAGTWKEISETQYELKECTDKRNDEYVKTKSEEYFVCTDKQWLEIDDIAYELKLCTESRKYELAATKKLGSYVCRFDGKESEWEKATDVETELGVCGGKGVKADSIYKTKENEYYLCKAASWSESNQAAFELQPAGACTEENNLTSFETKNMGLYVCENKAWREATELETALGVCGGKDIKSDGIYKKETDEYYKCSAGKWEESTQLLYELQNAGACTEDKNLTTFETENLGLYVCENKAWREATELEVALGVCGGKDVMDSALVKTEAGAYYACLAQKWTPSDAVTYKLGFCKVSNADSVYKISNDIYYVCQKLNWEESSIQAFEIQALGACNEKNKFDIAPTETQGDYVCDGKSWRKETSLELEIGICGSESSPDSVVKLTEAGKYYACLAGEWKLSDEATYLLGYCSSALEDSVKWTGSFNANKPKIPDLASSGKFYECQDGSWKESNQIRFYYGAACTEDEMKKANDEFYYNKFGITYHASNYKTYLKPMVVLDLEAIEYVVCHNSEWKQITKLTFDLNEECTESNNYSFNQNGKPGFVCEYNEWRDASNVELKLGICNSEQIGVTGEHSGLPYLCYSADNHKYVWYEYIEDSRDQQKYPIVTIGDYVWMAKNLNFDYKNSKSSEILNFGRSYSFNQATNNLCPSTITSISDCKLTAPFKGICPEGWHIPGNKEWGNLVDAVERDAGKLKTITGWNDGENGTDEVGFAAVKGSSFWEARLGKVASYDWYHGFYRYFSNGSLSANSGASEHNIRCVKDPEN